jgi:hypothetical protein
MSLNKQEYTEMKDVAILLFFFGFSVFMPVLMFVWLIAQ